MATEHDMSTERELRMKEIRLLIEEADSGPGTGHMLVRSDVWIKHLIWALDDIAYLVEEYYILQNDYNKMKEERMKGVWAGTKQSPVESES